MRLTTKSTERSLGYLVAQQLNNKPAYPTASEASLVETLGALEDKMLLVVKENKGQDRLDRRFDRYNVDNTVNSSKCIDMAGMHLRSFNNYTKL